MRINEAEFARLPTHLKAMFKQLPNPQGDEVEAAFAAFPTHSAGAARDRLITTDYNASGYDTSGTHNMRRLGDTGTASRFFFCGKATSEDRMGSRHATIKPLSLMRWLCLLITPPGGTILDPFCGSGTTLLAADRLQFNAIGIEQSAEYVVDTKRRLKTDSGLFAGLE